MESVVNTLVQSTIMNFNNMETANVQAPEPSQERPKTPPKKETQLFRTVTYMKRMSVKPVFDTRNISTNKLIGVHASIVASANVKI